MKQLSFNVFFIVRKNREGSVGRFKDRQKLIYLDCQPSITMKRLCIYHKFTKRFLKWFYSFLLKLCSEAGKLLYVTTGEKNIQEVQWFYWTQELLVPVEKFISRVRSQPLYFSDEKSITVEK